MRRGSSKAQTEGQSNEALMSDGGRGGVEEQKAGVIAGRG